MRQRWKVAAKKRRARLGLGEEQRGPGLAIVKPDAESLPDRLDIFIGLVEQDVQDIPQDGEGGFHFLEQAVGNPAVALLLRIPLLAERLAVGVEKQHVDRSSLTKNCQQICPMSVQDAKGVDAHDAESLEADLLKELALRLDGVPTLSFVTVSGICHVVSAW